MAVFRREWTLPPVTSSTRSTSGRQRPRMTSRLAIQQSVIWAALNLHASIDALMPIDVYRVVDGIKRPVPTPPVLVSPSSFGEGQPETIAEWLYQRRMALKGWGNFFGEITARDALGLPRQIQPVPPEEVRMRISRWRIVEWYFGGVKMDPAKVWHERGAILPGNPVGMNAIASSMMSAEVAAIAAEYLADWFGNSATPGGILRNRQKVLGDTQKAKVKATYNSSVQNGDVFVTGADWEWVGTQAKAAESGFLEAMNVSDVQLCRFFDTPANMIDVPVQGSATINYANVTQKNLDYLIMRKASDLKRTDDMITGRLLPRPQYGKVNRAAFLAMDPASAADMMKVQIDARLRTPSELRMLDDHAPLTDADYAEFDRLFGSKNQTPAPKGLPA